MKPVHLLIIPVLVLCSCSTPMAPEYNEIPAFLNEVSRGWGFFGQSQYGLAASSFREAIVINTNRERPEAHIGLGWSLAMQDSLPEAIGNFNIALSRTPETVEDSVSILAGLSLAYRDIVPPSFPLVKTNAQGALRIEPNFRFAYKSSINSDDLNAVLAEACFNLEQYTEAAAIADPAGSLDPDDADYQEKLLAKINILLSVSLAGG